MHKPKSEGLDKHDLHKTASFFVVECFFFKLHGDAAED